jgi:catechol 2,3-dioxygenase-like lactoylglutathione lyase family enzyme
MGILGVNHIAFRTPDPAGLKAFYRELLGAEELTGSHDPLRVGHTLLVFFPSERGGAADDPDELAFDADRAGFEETLERARALGALQREPVEPTPWSRAFLLRDPDGRRIEITYDDRGVYWHEDE